MSKAKVSELLLDALNRCLPLTAEDDKGCEGCPYEKICAEDDLPVTVGIPAQMIEDIRKYLKYREKHFAEWAKRNEAHVCATCGRASSNRLHTTACPIEEHYALPLDGGCHLWEEVRNEVAG